MPRKCPTNVPQKKREAGRLRIGAGQLTYFYRRYFLGNTQARDSRGLRWASASAAPRWGWQTAGSAICWVASDRTTGRLPQK